MRVGTELQWGWGQEDGLEEGREAEALRRRARRPRPRRGLRAAKGGSSLVLHVTVGLLPKRVQSLLSPERKKHHPNVTLT